MQIEEAIKILAVKSDLSMAEIARRLGKSPQSFNQKVKRGTWSLAELEDVALVTGNTLECAIVLPNGERMDIGGGR